MPLVLAGAAGGGTFAAGGSALAALGVASAGLGVASSIAQGAAASNAEKANAKIAEQNAAIATKNAEFAGAEGEANVGQQGEKNRAVAGTIKATQGASGIDVNTGSNANVQVSQAKLGQLDMANIRANAVRQAYGYQTQSTSFEGQAAADNAAAKNSTTAGFVSGAANAVRGAATIAGSLPGSGSVSADNGVPYEDSALGSSSSDPWSLYQNNNSLG